MSISSVPVTVRLVGARGPAGPETEESIQQAQAAQAAAEAARDEAVPAAADAIAAQDAAELASTTAVNLVGAASSSPRALATLGGMTLPADIVRYFGANGGTAPWYGNGTYPPSEYYEDLNETWVTWEAWNSRLLRREIWVGVYNHSVKRWTGNWFVGVNPLRDDDHGVPAICRDAFGRAHVFFGAHGHPMQHATTVRPNDPTQWFMQTPIGDAHPNGYTYPHPSVVDGVLHLFMRGRAAADILSLFYFKGTVASDGAVSWSTATEVINLDSDSRTYTYKHQIVGTDIHMPWVRAKYDDTERRNVYFAVFDTVTETFSNLAGSVTGQAHINLTEANDSFRLIETGTTYPYTTVDYAWDKVTEGLLHLVYLDTDDERWVHVPYTNGVAGSETSFYPASGGRQCAVFAREEGGFELWFPEDDDDEHEVQNGGNIRRTGKLPDGGNFATQLMMRPEGSKPLYVPSSVRNGHPDFRLIFCEWAGVTPETEDGTLRLYGWGDNGPVWREAAGPHNVRLHLNNQALATTFPTTQPIAMLLADSPIDTTITFDTDHALFSVADGYLVTDAQLTDPDTYYPVIEATDSLGNVSHTPVAVPVIAVGTGYTFTNTEAQLYVTRTRSFMRTAERQAIDAFVSEGKSSGWWQKLDWLIPPRAKNAYAATRNMVQNDFHMTLQHGSGQVIFSPGDPDPNDFLHIRLWKVSAAEEAYIDTGFNPSTAGGNFSQNSACVGLDYGGGSTSNPIFGHLESSPAQGVSISISATGFAARLNQVAATAASGIMSTEAERRALWIANRSGASAVQLYRNGVALGVTANGSESSISMKNATLKIGNYSSGAFNWGVFNGGFAGGSLTSGQVASLAAAWETLKAALT